MSIKSRKQKNKMTLVGLEPTISGSVDRCLIHWATGPTTNKSSQYVILEGWSSAIKNENAPCWD